MTPGKREIRFGTREAAGAVADVGVLVPIAAALIVSNGLSATAVLLPAGLLYIAAGAVYRLPVPVQPLKAFAGHALEPSLAVPLGAAFLLVALLFRRHLIALILVAAGLAVALAD